MGKKALNPADAHRKALKEKFRKRCKKERQDNRVTVMSNRKVEDIVEEIQKINRMDAAGHLDKKHNDRRDYLEKNFRHLKEIGKVKSTAMPSRTDFGGKEIGFGYKPIDEAAPANLPVPDFPDENEMPMDLPIPGDEEMPADLPMPGDPPSIPSPPPGAPPMVYPGMPAPLVPPPFAPALIPGPPTGMPGPPGALPGPPALPPAVKENATEVKKDEVKVNRRVTVKDGMTSVSAGSSVPQSLMKSANAFIPSTARRAGTASARARSAPLGTGTFKPKKMVVAGGIGGVKAQPKPSTASTDYAAFEAEMAALGTM